MPTILGAGLQKIEVAPDNKIERLFDQRRQRFNVYKDKYSNKCDPMIVNADMKHYLQQMCEVFGHTKVPLLVSELNHINSCKTMYEYTQFILMQVGCIKHLDTAIRTAKTKIGLPIHDSLSLDIQDLATPEITRLFAIVEVEVPRLRRMSLPTGDYLTLPPNYSYSCTFVSEVQAAIESVLLLDGLAIENTRSIHGALASITSEILQVYL